KTTLVLMLTQQLETLRIEEARESPTLEIVQPPVAPKQRVFPKRTLMVLEFTAIAFILGCLWLTVVAYLRRLSRDPAKAEFWRQFSGAVLEQIPARRSR
ncbi:MAG TPA: hypothetical protein P5266_00565, partial [Candidatus Fermentibacter sp.]|nr:hypothetical protein [Candidatus Fermentibacter sp.]